MIHSTLNSDWPDRVPLHVLGLLEAQERVAFENHLTECGDCVKEVAAARDIAGEIGFAAPAASPSRAVRERLLRLVLPG